MNGKEFFARQRHIETPSGTIGYVEQGSGPVPTRGAAEAVEARQRGAGLGDGARLVSRPGQQLGLF